MKINFLRSATLIIQSDEHVILVDPMLSRKGAMPTFSFFRHKAARNPLVELPNNAASALREVTVGLITHCQNKHVDHLDSKGEELLRGGNVPTYCRQDDYRYLKKRGLAAHGLSMQVRQPFLGGHITLIPARHGHGWISALMGPGVGYVIELPNEPSVYISGDTVMTDDVRNALKDHQPDIAIVAAGNASTDVGKPILMSLDEVMEFTSLAPRKVVANHLEALNHCPVTRKQVAQSAIHAGLADRLMIPADGDVIEFERN